MFQTNKYSRWYFSIIDAAKARSLDCSVPVERHHILPKSLGGQDDSSNIVNLTLREHVLCHMLLTKMTSGVALQKMQFAFNLMANRSKMTSHHIAHARKCAVDAAKSQPRSQLWRTNISIAKTGKKIKGHVKTESAKKSISNARLGSRHSALTKDKISNAMSIVMTSMTSAERKAKFGHANDAKYANGYSLTPDSRKAISDTLKKTLAEQNKNRKIWKIKCPDLSIVIVTNLQDFCKSQGIIETSLKNTIRTQKPVSRGPTKGYQII